MRRSAVLFPAIGALALLPAVSAPAGAASCRDEVQQLAQTFHLSLGPMAQGSAQPSHGATAEAPGSNATAAEPRGGADWAKVQEMLSQGEGASGQGTGRTAEAPATTESRGIAGPDSLESSGGTLPPSTGTPAPEQRSGAAPAQQLGAADRAKAEGLLSEAQAADAQGKGDQCLQILRAAQAMLLKGRQ